MPLLYRFIFRVDFGQCYEIADRPGTVIQTIQQASKSYWEIVGPTNNPFQINSVNNAGRESGRSVSNFTVDTNAISGSLEFESGLELKELLKDPYIETCSVALDAMLDIFKIRNFNRVGMRLFLTGGETSDFERHRKQVSTSFAALNVPTELGRDMEVTDVAAIFNGKLAHDVQFRLQCGPGAETDIRQFVSQFRSNGENNRPAKPHAYSVDVDIFQQNLNFKGTNLLRWIKAKDPHLEKVLAVAATFEKGK